VETAQRKVALIVANGKPHMGLSIATRLTNAGHDVFLVGENIDPGLCDEGAPVTFRLTWRGLDADGVARSVESLIERVPHADVLVIAADAFGASDHGPTRVESLATSEWNSVVLENLTAPFLVVKAYASGMQKQRWGRVLFVIPEEVRARPDGAGAHSIASKAGLIGLARTLVHELGPDQVTVNCVSSGADSSRPAAGVNRECPHVTLRQAEAIDAAEAVAFLASEGASFITGMTLDVNGGRSML
jgi:3-oxoacyl-[acyl-carrier protein] reductase